MIIHALIRGNIFICKLSTINIYHRVFSSCMHSAWDLWLDIVKAPSSHVLLIFPARCPMQEVGQEVANEPQAHVTQQP